MLYLLVLLFVTLCSATDTNSSSKPRHSKLPSFCNGGQSGTWTYITAVPGFPGAPGRDGAKGDLGNPGKIGPQGPTGAEGKKGVKGEPGIQGSTGQKGERGDKGESGTPQLSSYMNWKECTWKKVDGRDSGEIYTCDFMKNYTDTALHVYFAGNLRIYNCDQCCNRWYFTFNGTECSSPGPIEGAIYMQTGRRPLQNLHRHRHIEGHCNNINKGKVRVGFWVGKCNTGYKSGDADTGWAEMSRIFIEEVPKPQQ